MCGKISHLTKALSFMGMEKKGTFLAIRVAKKVWKVLVTKSPNWQRRFHSRNMVLSRETNLAAVDISTMKQLSCMAI